MRTNIFVAAIFSVSIISACSEGGNTNGFNGQIPGSLPASATDIPLGPEPELQPEIIPDNLMPPPPLNEEVISDDGVSDSMDMVPSTLPNSLFVPPASIIDPITSIEEIQSNTENLVNEYEDLLRQYLVQANDIHQLIGSGIQTSDDSRILRYDVDFYNELLACAPTLNQYSEVDSFDCTESTATLNYRHDVYPDVLITLDRMNLGETLFGNTFTTIFQNNEDTNLFAITINNIITDDGNTLIVTRSPEDFTCEVNYWPFSIDEINMNACNATLGMARDVLKSLLGY